MRRKLRLKEWNNLPETNNSAKLLLSLQAPGQVTLDHAQLSQSFWIGNFLASRAISNQNGLPWGRRGDSGAPLLRKHWRENLCQLVREGIEEIQASYAELNPMLPKVLSSSGILWCCVFFSSSHVILFSPGCTQMYVQISVCYLNLALGVRLPW